MSFVQGSRAVVEAAIVDVEVKNAYEVSLVDIAGYQQIGVNLVGPVLTFSGGV